MGPTFTDPARPDAAPWPKPDAPFAQLVLIANQYLHPPEEDTPKRLRKSRVAA